MNVPDSTREEIRRVLWSRAEALQWVRLSSSDKAKHYEVWTSDPEIGGVLRRFMNQGHVRVYIKDTLLKGFSSSWLGGCERPFRVLGVSIDVSVIATYVKPHGRGLADGRLICWGRAGDWKTIVMAMHERCYAEARMRPYAAVFLLSFGRFGDPQAREPVEDACRKLGIERVVWIP